MHGWRAARTGEDDRQVHECEWQRADGQRFPAAITYSFLRFGSREYLVVFLADITERRRASAQLQESEARLKAMAGNVPGLVFRLERETPQGAVRIAYISEASQRLVGYSAERLLEPERGIRSLVHADDEADYWASQQLALEKSQDWRWQGRILNRDGEVRWADIRASVRGQPDGRQVWDGIVWDITDNKRIELELDASRAQLRELAAHLETVREEEKAHIAREVHDELGQVLTVLKLETSMCELGFADLDPALAQRLESMKRLIAQLFQRVRDVATALRKVAGGGRYIDPALADRMVFEVGLTDSRPPHALLSEREYSVFERLVQGDSVNDIAGKLTLSSKTISTHKARLMQKLAAHSVADLVRYAMEHKLV